MSAANAIQENAVSRELLGGSAHLRLHIEGLLPANFLKINHPQSILAARPPGTDIPAFTSKTFTESSDDNDRTGC